jgi:TonB-dependent starch-binding outer membrane protein SusC
VSRFGWFGALALLLVTATAAYAQTREITGRITSAATGAPIADVSVGVIGMPVGARTNANGEFRLTRVPAGDVQVATRALGYKRQQVRVPATQTSADFKLDRDVLQLEGVTITGAATAVEKRNATSAVASVNSEELNRVPAVSFENALQGKALGAFVNMNNGAPGGGGQIQVRGASSLLGKIDPLIVVDGVIISNDVRRNFQAIITGSLNAGEENATNRLADINPAEIENVEVLKGSVASAIYGSQATNGVVVITTKHGRSGAPRISLSQRLGVYSLLKNLGTRHFTDSTMALGASVIAGNAAGEAAVRKVCRPTCPYHDYIGDFYGRKDPSFETNLSLSGGVENTKYFVSASNRQDAGIAMNTGARLQSMRLNVDQTLGTRITLNVGGNLVRGFRQRGISNNDNTNSSPMYAFPYTPALIDLKTQDAQGNYPTNPFVYDPAYGSNPWQTFALLKNNEDEYRLMTNGRISWAAWSNVTNDVSFNVMAGADRSSQESYQLAPRSLQFELPGTQNGTYPGAVIQGNGDALFHNASLNGVWKYNPENRWFTSTVSAGLQDEARAHNDYNLILQGLIPGVASATGATRTQTTNSRDLIKNQSYYVQEELLALDEKLLLSAAVRGEKSSVFGDREKLFTFPRYGASYRLSNPIPFVSEFKIRGTVGSAGNQPNYGERYITLTNFAQENGQVGLTVSAASGNPKIKPERMTESEAGFDVSGLSDRVHLEATWFKRDISDLLLRPQLAQSTGVTQVVVNGGKMQTTGSEIGLTLVPYTARDINWTSRSTFQSTRSLIKEFNPGVLPFALGAQGGFGTAYGRLKFTPGQSTSAIHGRAIRADKTIAIDTVLADANPKFQMAFTNDVTWGNWSLGTLLDWRSGGAVSSLQLNLFDEGNNTWDYDKPSPDPAVGKTLGDWRYNAWGNGKNTSVYLQDGSFVKLREVTVAYEVPRNYLARLGNLGVSTARLSLSGRNLHLWTGYNGYDPEVNNGGNVVARFVDLGQFPPSKSFFFTVDLGF